MLNSDVLAGDGLGDAISVYPELLLWKFPSQAEIERLLLFHLTGTLPRIVN